MPEFKTWKEKPTELEAQKAVEDFFAYLKKGELENAKNSVDHLYDDWEESIHVIWRDHYLIHEIAEDESFEGKEWLNNLEWTQNLGILDDFMWAEENDSNNRYFDVSVTYMDEPSGFAAQFYLVKNDDHYVVKRGLIDMA